MRKKIILFLTLTIFLFSIVAVMVSAETYVPYKVNGKIAYYRTTSAFSSYYSKINGNYHAIPVQQVISRGYVKPVKGTDAAGTIAYDVSGNYYAKDVGKETYSTLAPITVIARGIVKPVKDNRDLATYNVAGKYYYLASGEAQLLPPLSALDRGLVKSTVKSNTGVPLYHVGNVYYYQNVDNKGTISYSVWGTAPTIASAVARTKVTATCCSC